MAVFEYNAVDLDASAVGGTVMADSPRQARDLLRARGLTVTNLHALERADTLSFRQRRRGKSAQYQVVAFVRELATLSAAGIPLLSALHTLAEQHRGHFRTVIEVLADAVASGTSLAEAMERHPEYFDELCHNVVQVGESTGGLEQALRRLAEFKEKAHRLRSRVITALIYPAIVGTVGLAVAVFMMTFVVPNLLSTLANAGRPLPWVTQVVKSCSELLVRWWWALLLGAGAAGAGLRLIWRSPPGRLAVDRLVLRVPIIGELITKETTSRMAVVMAALLRSGLDFVQAVRITKRTLHNTVFRRAMDDYEAAVGAGSDISGPLRASGVFSPMVVQMLAVGQQSGELEELLEQLATSYSHEVDVATTRLTAVLEPLLIVLLAVVIGFIAFATILPILEISNVL